MNGTQANACAMAGFKVRRSGWTAGNHVVWDGVDLVDQAAAHYNMTTADWAGLDWERYEATLNDFDWAVDEWQAGRTAARAGWSQAMHSGSGVGRLTTADVAAVDWLS